MPLLYERHLSLIACSIPRYFRRLFDGRIKTIQARAALHLYVCMVPISQAETFRANNNVRHGYVLMYYFPHRSKKDMSKVRFVLSHNSISLPGRWPQGCRVIDYRMDDTHKRYRITRSSQLNYSLLGKFITCCLCQVGL